MEKIKPSRLSSVKILPSRRHRHFNTTSAWEVFDKKGKLVGWFDANKDKTRDKYDKLLDIAKVRNIAHDLHDVQQSIKELTHNDNPWQVKDRASQAFSNIEDAFEPLDQLLQYIKQA